MKLRVQPAAAVRRKHAASKISLVALLALGAIFWLWPPRRARGDNLVVYLPSARQLVPIQVLDNARYLPLIKILSFVGTVDTLEEKRGTLKISIDDNRVEFHDGNNKVKVNKHDFRLMSPVRVDNGQWLVPLDFLDLILPQLSNQSIRYRAGDERLFLGNVNPLTFTARLSPITNGDRLDVQFTAPIAIQTASTNGQWVIFLGDKALMPLEQEMKFQSRFVNQLRFDDQDGVPKLIITPSEANLNFTPSMSDGGKTLQMDITQAAAPPVQTAAGPPKPAIAVAQPGAAPTTQAPAAAPSAASNAAQPGAASAPALPAPALPVVVIDPGHGGPDAGGHSRDGVTERDLVAGLAARVESALSATGKFHVLLTRTGSNDPTSDERDSMANVAHPVAFLTLHAGDLGDATPAIAIYTYQAPSLPAPLAASHGLFVPWDLAQQAHLVRSRDFASSLAQQFGHIQSLETRGPLAAPVRQLRSVDAPAVALELGTLAPRADAVALSAASLEDQLANAIAQAVLALTQGAS